MRAGDFQTPSRPAVAELAAADRRRLTDLLVQAVSPGRPISWSHPDPETLSWAALPAHAEGHGVAALVAEMAASQWPEALRPALEHAAGRTIERGERLAEDWRRLADCLTAARVPFAPLKWAAFAARLYPRAALRPAADLDLFVPQAAAEAAAQVLTALGYQTVALTWKHRVYLRPDNQTVVDRRGEHPDNPRPVELHTWLGESFRGIRLDLTGEAQVRSPATVLPDALQLLHLASHATVDALGRRLRLIQLLDLARLADLLTDRDWRWLLERSALPAAARFAWPALELSRRELGAAIPPGVLEDLRAQVAPALVTWLVHEDLDSLSWFGRSASRRALGEVPAIWPRSARERATVWRFILWPGRLELADRYPRLAASRLWWLMLPRHLGYNAAVAARRWRSRR